MRSKQHNAHADWVASAFSWRVMISYPGWWLPFVGVMALSVGGPLSLVFYAALIGYALLGHRQLIQALFCSWLLGHLSPAFATPAGGVELMRIGVIISASFFVMADLLSGVARKSPNLDLQARGLLASLLLLWLYLLFNAIFVSELPTISALKATLICLLIAVLFVSWPKANRSGGMEVWISSWVLALMFASAALSLHPLGYLRNGFGLQGVLSQPQALGIAAALAVSLAAARLLTLGRASLPVLIQVLVLVAVLLATRARAGIFAVGAALSVTYVFGLLVAHQALRKQLFRLAASIACVLVLVGTGVLLFDNQALEFLSGLLRKGGQSSTFFGALYESRGTLLATAMEGFSANPLLGNGFGIAFGTRQWEVIRDPLFDLPISAPSETGVFYAAILSEAGLIGFGLFLVVLWKMLMMAHRNERLDMVFVMLTGVFVNFGEAIMLSANGMGQLLWIIFALAAFSGQNRDVRQVSQGHRPTRKSKMSPLKQT